MASCQDPETEENIMSFDLINKVNQAQKKQAVVDARSGDTVHVYQKIKEGNKERIQMFEGVVIRTDNKQSHTWYEKFQPCLRLP